MTPKKALHPALQGFFAKHRAASADRRSDLSGQMKPIAQLIAAVRMQVMEMQTDLQAAELEASGDQFTSKLQYMHTRLEALDARATAFYQASRELMRVIAEVESGLGQDQIDLVAMMPGGPDGE
jgi:hypothetical protein